jgi:hypothetical protein
MSFFPRAFEFELRFMRLFAYGERDKSRQGVLANTLEAFCNEAVGFIDWLGLVLAMRTPHGQKRDAMHTLY